MSELDAIRARRAAISPGRWYEDADETGQDYIYLGTDGGRLYVGDMSETTRQEHADAAFIAAAPADIDALLARVAELEAALQDAIDALGWAPPIDCTPSRYADWVGRVQPQELSARLEAVQDGA